MWKAFPEADEDSVRALADLGKIVPPTAETAAGIEKLVCLLTSRRHLFSTSKTNAILHLIKEQCSTNGCQCCEEGLKCTDLCCCNDVEDDGSCDNIANDKDHESFDVDNDHDGDDDEEEEEEDEGDRSITVTCQLHSSLIYENLVEDLPPQTMVTKHLKVKPRFHVRL